MQQSKIKLRVPAKINLSLDIVGRRADGYHLLEMVMQSIGLYDTLTIAANESDAFSMRIAVNRPQIPTDQRNIVYKAAKAFCETDEYRACGKPLALSVDIEKQIPDQAGMAGGSADAAGMLYGLNRLCGDLLSQKRLREIGLSVGADVPYCLHGQTTFVSGIGEELLPLRQLTEGYIVGARPQVGISTAEAYHSFDKTHPACGKTDSSAQTKELLAAVEFGDLQQIGQRLFNVFEDACPLPEVEALRQKLLSLGAAGARMTGSGSAVYGIFPLQHQAESAFEQLKTTESAAFFAPICGKIQLL
jgi:4-diphosphocytidyl-2-C-methyl-D-erythritol kinase